MPSEKFFATILDSKMPPGTQSKCAIISQTLAEARASKQWPGTERRRSATKWKHSRREAIEITHVPSGSKRQAAIYEMTLR